MWPTAAVALAAAWLLTSTLPVAAETPHTVRPGETLSAIAAQYGVSLHDLAERNAISNANHIVEGQTLVIWVTSPGPGAERSHRVAPGESLSALARRYGISIAELAAVNDIANPNLIVVGQLLRLPGGIGAPSRWVRWCSIASLPVRAWA